MKEHRHSKDETWIEDLRLPLRKGRLQAPLMELLNSFPLPYLTDRHLALPCKFGFDILIPSGWASFATTIDWQSK